jgi:hypothetical protein
MKGIEGGRVDGRDWILRLRPNRIRNWIQHYNLQGRGFRRYGPFIEGILM